MSDENARIAALLEREFGRLKNRDTSGMPEGFEVLNVGSFGSNSVKAVTVRDGNGNIYVHFNGTGDGNWKYNAAAYGAQPQPSDMQNWALRYFDKIYETYCQNGFNKSLYVTGHSQGGNNAQFVTMRSEYGNRISGCIALDAPGFSKQFVSDTKAMFGADYYERQRQLIYAYNGVNDYVSCLGQTSIIPENNVKYIEYTGKDMDFVAYHDIKGKLDGDYITVLDGNHSSDFRNLIIAINEKVVNLPPEQQARVAEIMMAIVENMKAGGNDPLTDADLEFLKTVLVPLLIDVLAENPGQISIALTAMGLDPALISIIEETLKDFNDLSLADRKKVLEAIFNFLVIEDGKIVFSSDWRDYINADSAKALIALLPVLENLVENAAEEYLRSKGVPEWAISFIMANVKLPIKVVSMVLRIIAVGVIIFDALRKAWDNFWNKAGRQYAANNPSFKVDTNKLRDYATRMSNVNKRLKNLDTSLHRVFWEVSAFDMLRFAWINFLTSGSPTLSLVKSYLNDTADEFDTAENKARNHMGG